MAGAVAATATAVALAPVQATPADIAVPAHATPSTQPRLSEAMIDLLAAAGRMTAALPVPGANGAETRPVRSFTRAVRATTNKVAADVQKATDDVRNAVRDAGPKASANSA